MFGVNIESVMNGYVVTIPKEEEDWIERKVVIAYREEEDTMHHPEAFKELVESLRDYFWCYYNKHKEKNFVCEIENIPVDYD